MNLRLTDQKCSFQFTQATEAGISDLHLLASTLMKAQTVRLKPKQTVYRNCKHFDEQYFLEDLQFFELSRNSDCPNEEYNYLIFRFLSVNNRHAPFKTKVIGANNPPFIN